MKTFSHTLAAAALLTSLVGGARAGVPYNGLPPVPADPAVMALANKAVGNACRFDPNKIGPQIAGLANLPKVGQGLEADGFTFVRRHGRQRVAFLAREVGKRCTILAAQPLPRAARSEEFLQCMVDNPDPAINTPISSGLGLRQNGRRDLAAYLEADIKAKTLTPRDGSDKRIHCYAFESGD